MRTLLRRPRNRRGQSLAEFAIVLPVFLLIVFAMIDIGRVIWASDDLAHAAREGARYASVHGNSFLVTCQTGPGLTATLAPSCSPWSPDVKEPTRVATRGYLIAPGTGVTISVCYYATTACSGNADQTNVIAQRGAYVTVTVTSTVPILTGALLGWSGFAVSGSSTVLVNN